MTRRGLRGSTAADGCRVRGGCARAGLSTRLPNRRAKVAAVAFVIAALAVLVVAAPSLSIAGAGFLLVYLMVGLQGPVMAGLLHSRVDSPCAPR